MSYIGKTPTSVPLTSSDITDGIITTTKIADDAATADKIANAVNTSIANNTAKTTNATHSGEVTGSGALTIADNVVDEANLKVSNSPTNGYFLAAQSGNTGGLTWQEAGGGGKVLQVLQALKTDTFSTTTTLDSFADITGLSQAITPSASNSKILVMATFTANIFNENHMSAFRLLRGSTSVFIGDSRGSTTRASSGKFADGGGNYPDNVSFQYLDSPSTTNAVTYKVQGSTRGSTLTIGGSYYTSAGWQISTPSSLIVMEIGA